jgi:hypothetical protein
MTIDVSTFASAVKLDPELAAKFVEVNQRLQSLSEILDQAVRAAIDQANSRKFDLEQESRALWEKTLGDLGMDTTSANWAADIKDVNNAFIFANTELQEAMRAEQVAMFGGEPEPIDGTQTVAVDPIDPATDPVMPAN